MKLYTNCMSCKKDIIVKSNAQTRPDLQMEKGEEFVVNCLSCGRTDKKHVNDIKAESNGFILLVGLVLGGIMTSILWFFYGAIASIVIAIPLIFWQQQMKATKSFNSYMIRRK
ncbi:MAG: hypothetical protein HWD89_05390 [Tenacibaculum sp.]|uniref:hypothetical protein n=1 Tax=Tenacibaculum sp. TaxID=1906242 RepID=UPI0017F5B652|nr:hypothetical protein [Tenacibaculum sp.]NVK08465.1 hypothetical protein [Tenacibaculum sp.]